MAMARMASAPRATPTPMPALAPVERPEEAALAVDEELAALVGVAEADCGPVVRVSVTESVEGDGFRPCSIRMGVVGWEP